MPWQTIWDYVVLGWIIFMVLWLIMFVLGYCSRHGKWPFN